MIQRKGHHIEGRVTTWREGCNDSKEGSPHRGKGHHTTWREGSPHGGKVVMIPRKGTPHGGKGHHMEGRV